MFAKYKMISYKISKWLIPSKFYFPIVELHQLKKKIILHKNILSNVFKFQGKYLKIRPNM